LNLWLVAYLLLLISVHVIFLNNSAILNASSVGARISAQSVLQAASECMTPRGLNKNVAEKSLEFDPKSPIEENKLYHDLYVWNGTLCSCLKSKINAGRQIHREARENGS
jgi:hypothetical protein